MKTGKIIEIRSNAHNQIAIINYSFVHKDEEITAKLIAKEKNRKPSGITQALKKLHEQGVLDGYKGKANHRPMFHPKMELILTEETIEKLKEQWKKQGYTDEQINSMIDKLLEESIPFRPPDEWKMYLNHGWKIIA